MTNEKILMKIKSKLLLILLFFSFIVIAILSVNYLNKVKYYQPVTISIKNISLPDSKNIHVFGTTPFGRKIDFQKPDTASIWYNSWGYLKQLNIVIPDSLMNDSLIIDLKIGDNSFSYNKSLLLKDWKLIKSSENTIYISGDHIKGKENIFLKGFSIFYWNDYVKNYTLIFVILLICILFRIKLKLIISTYGKDPINILLFIFLVTGTILLINKILLINNYSLDYHGIEQYMVGLIQKIIIKSPLYKNPYLPPFLPMTYTLLYFKINALIDSLFISNETFNFNNVHLIYVLGRTTSLIFSLGIISMVFLIFKKITKEGWKPALIITILSFLVLSPHYFAVRPDALKTFLYLAAIFLFLKYIKKRKTITLIFISILCLLSIFSKQDAIGLPFMLAGFLLFTRKFKALLIFVLSFIIGFFMIIFIHYLSFGNDFIKNGLLLLDFEGVDAYWFVNVMIPRYFLSIFIFYLFSIVIAAKWLRSNYSEEMKFVAYMVLTTFLFSLLISIRWGSTPVYYTEFHLLSIIVITAFLLITYRNIKNVMFAKLRKPLMIVVLIFIGFLLIMYNTIYKATLFYSKSDNYNMYLKDKELYDISQYVKSKNILIGNKYISDFNFEISVYIDEKFLNPKVTELWALYGVRHDKLEYSFNNSNTQYGLKYLKDGYYAYFLVENDLTSKEFIRQEMPEYSLYKDFTHYSLYEFQSETTIK